MNRTSLTTSAALIVGGLAIGAFLTSTGAFNWGQILCWIAFVSAVTAGFSWWLCILGNDRAEPVARGAYRVQWLALLGGAAFLWWILFRHRFDFQYVHDYSSQDMPWYYVFAAFWGGQEGTFLLWAFLSTTLGLFLMYSRHSLARTAMFFSNLPMIMLTFIGAVRGPFLASKEAYTNGVGLNPLLQDWWMTIHPPVLFIGFSSFLFPFAIACAALLRRDYDGWVKPVMPWAVFATAVQATGFIMGGVWAYKVLGWGGYWGWDPVENGSLIPWLATVGLVHGLLVQRVTGSLRVTNFVLAILSYVLVLYASFLTRSGVLADFSVHSFAANDTWHLPFGLGGFLVFMIATAAVVGFGLLFSRLSHIPRSPEPLGAFSRESFMWLGQLVFILMCALITIGMSAPLITRLFGPPSNVQTTYYNLVNAPLAVAMGVLLGIAPLLRWRQSEPEAFVRAALPSIAFAAAATVVMVVAGVRELMPALVLFAMSFALAANTVVMVRGFRASWKHGAAFLGHMGLSIMLIGVVASSGYGITDQVQLPRGETRNVLGYMMNFQGMQRDSTDGKDHAIIAVTSAERDFTANAKFYWSEYNQGYMKKPHIERFWNRDVYIAPLDMVGGADVGGVWFMPGETKRFGEVSYTFNGFRPEPSGTGMKLTAEIVVDIGGRTVPARPEFVISSGKRTSTPAYLPSGGTISIVSGDPQSGRALLSLPNQEVAADSQTLAVEVSTKPFINLVWIGSVVMLLSAFLSVLRRAIEQRREPVGGKAA